MTEHKHDHPSMDSELDLKLASVRQTKPRKLVMEILKQATAPMSAVEILAEVEKAGEQIWLSTIYRVLELFVEKEIAVKSTLLGTHYAICVVCHRIIPMDNCPIAAVGFSPGLQEENFRVTGHKIEIYGYCSQCEKTK